MTQCYVQINVYYMTPPCSTALPRRFSKNLLNLDSGAHSSSSSANALLCTHPCAPHTQPDSSAASDSHVHSSNTSCSPCNKGALFRPTQRRILRIRPLAGADQVEDRRHPAFATLYAENAPPYLLLSP
mmetsp:Transcript_25724/g.55724  ORF Transcript_25724/g.55724 Transcript_25724/m.55724 type:complete len:128 (+) Transcript_25724:59-442(+)